MKKLVLFVLILSLAFGMYLPVSAAYSQFSDVTDWDTQVNVDVLRMMDVVKGDGNGNFRPSDKLTRAEFCKMAVIVMDRGDDEYIYRNRTIFPDVRSNHWARGYINLAVTAEKKIIIGNSDGAFRPDDNITYAQAVTMLMRLLGYADADAGMLWPQGYIELAADCGLTEGLSLTSNTYITRAQAAELFCNLLSTNQKSGTKYASNLGTVYSDTVVMSDDATADDGTQGAISTSQGTFLPKSGIVPSSFVGLRGLLVTDSDGFALTFIPDSGKTVSIIAASAQAGWIKDSTGTTYTISGDTPAYTAEEQSTYSALWMDIYVGCKANVYFTSSGKVDGIYIGGAVSETAMAAYSSFRGNPFTSLLDGATGYTIYKNGTKASVSDLRQYDVATYDKSSKILHVSDVRLTGTYENASPNREYPSVVKLMGKNFTVLPSAVSALSKFEIGDSITLLLTSDLQVAGAVNTSLARSNAVGIVKTCTESSAEVELFIGITLSGDINLSSATAQNYVGQLVTVSSSGKGKIGLSKLSGSSVSGELNMNTLKIGSVSLSDGVKFFEQVGTSKLTQIAAEDILQSTISSSKISYVSVDYAGRANIIVMSDVTGDMYTYGMIETNTVTGPESGGLTATNRTIAITNAAGTTSALISSAKAKDGGFGGIVAALDGERTSGVISLESIEKIKRSDFKTGDNITLSTTKGVFVVSDDVVCYNNVTGLWFDSLDQARAFSDNLTVYYDKLPDLGGKIRIVVAK